MSNQRWKAKWKADDIAFHQAEVNPHLTEFWPRLALEPGARVLVPLCGKNHDLSWLQQQGHRVIGIELSHIAIAAFFAGRGETPQRQRLGRFQRWWCGDIEIWCGDLFDLQPQLLGDIAAIYDCAALTALTALPAASRGHYVRQLSALLDESGQMLLLTTESSDAGDQAEDAQTPDPEVPVTRPRMRKPRIRRCWPCIRVAMRWRCCMVTPVCGWIRSSPPCPPVCWQRRFIIWDPWCRAAARRPKAGSWWSDSGLGRFGPVWAGSGLDRFRPRRLGRLANLPLAGAG